ncbi:f-box protein pof6 [Pseudohyphozyma bogoriensis]|nr:f-box protein pof6 [Pseudohyphozyma bogoriensis]
MERWQALLPDKAASGHQSSSLRLPRPPPLIGRLPEEAYLAILRYLPVPDLPAFALSSRKFASLTRDDRLWRTKLAWLDYRGPGAIQWRARPSEGAGAGAANTNAADAAFTVPSPTTARALDPFPPPSAYTDDDFGDFVQEGEGDVSLVHDDGFGDFQDFEAPPILQGGLASDPFGLNDGFGDLSVNGKPSAPVASGGGGGGGGDDLMMLFDDDNDIASSAKPAPPKAAPTNADPKPAPPKSRPSLPIPSSTVTNLPLREVFKAHHALLIPYYLSLQTHTTSSLLFTSQSLDPHTRSLLLSSLVRFCEPLVAPTRSLPQRQTVLRNVQSAMDFFESALLAEFERADNKGDEEAMSEKARILWELNGSAGSVIQVFVQKREIFYDQSHNPLRNLVKVDGPHGEKVDGIDFSAMDSYMKDVLRVMSRDGSLIARIFPDEADVLIYFTERIANDVVSDYITTLLADAQGLQQPLFLLATAATFGQVYRLVDAVLAVEPKNEEYVTKERAEDVVFRMFEPHMDDYLQEEGEWIREVLEGMCGDWDQKTASDSAISDPTFLASQNPAMVKKNVLAGFTKVLLLPVTIIPKTASMGLSAITSGATGAFNTFAQFGTQLTSGVASGTRTPSTPVEVSPDPDAPRWSTEDAQPRLSIDQSGTVSFTSSSEATTTSLPGTSTTSLSSTPTKDLKSGRFDRMQLLLSLDTALQLIQADRDCLKRIQTFIRYPGTYGRKVRDAIEEVFIILLQTLGEKHVCPGFAKATSQMTRFKPEEHESGTTVAPLVQFFELVHIGDTIQQMVDVYYEKEMASYIDKKDFLNAVVREKKRFETSLDDAVAQGLNAGVNILMNQVEHVIFTHQGLRDFSPPEGADLDLQPTLACTEAIDVLKTHCAMLKGSTDKQILEVFHSEVGIRLHGILLKHLKRLIVSVQGGFQLISDLNAYHAFVSSLRQPQVTAYFTSLKMVGEIFIVDSPKDLSHLVRDVSRYDGTLSTEDLYEIVQRRADWTTIQREVERGLFGFGKEDCTAPAPFHHSHARGVLGSFPVALLAACLFLSSISRDALAATSTSFLPSLTLDKRAEETTAYTCACKVEHRNNAVFAVEAAMIPVLVIISGILAGLTLGYMSLDSTQLNVLAKTGTPKQRYYAKRVIPIRKDGHLLLITLLLGNMIAVNETLPVITDGVLGGGVQAVVISTVLVVIFSEIIPQSVCSRFGLAIGSAMVFPTRCLIYIFYIVAWPVARLLTYLLGSHSGVVYRRAELKELISMHGAGAEGGHGGDLDRDTVTIVGATLDLQAKVVADAMTPISKVFQLDINSKLDYETLGKVLKAGHSRIPVYEETVVGDITTKKIVGVLLTKQLILLDPEDAVPLKEIPMNALPTVSEDLPLLQILNTFQEGRSHMAIVHRRKAGFNPITSPSSTIPSELSDKEKLNQADSDMEKGEATGEQSMLKSLFHRKRKGSGGSGSSGSDEGEPIQMKPTPRGSIASTSGFDQDGMVGVITLEDVLEELIGEEIYDETDVIGDQKPALETYVPPEAVGRLGGVGPPPAPSTGAAKVAPTKTAGINKVFGIKVGRSRSAPGRNRSSDGTASGPPAAPGILAIPPREETVNPPAQSTTPVFTAEPASLSQIQETGSSDGEGTVVEKPAAPTPPGILRRTTDNGTAGTPATRPPPLLHDAVLLERGRRLLVAQGADPNALPNLRLAAPRSQPPSRSGTPTPGGSNRLVVPPPAGTSARKGAFKSPALNTPLPTRSSTQPSGATTPRTEGAEFGSEKKDDARETEEQKAEDKE